MKFVKFKTDGGIDILIAVESVCSVKTVNKDEGTFLINTVDNCNIYVKCASLQTLVERFQEAEYV